MNEYLEFSLPAGGFDGPVALWLACHHRLEGICRLLRRFARHVNDSGADEAARTFAEGVRRYFNVASPRHQDDEDVDLFPRVLDRLSGRRRATVRSIMARLQDDHVVANRLWATLDGQLAEVQRGGAAKPEAGALERLAQNCLTHREAEETALLPIVRATLQPADLAQIAEAMARRRGLTWAELNSGLR